MVFSSFFLDGYLILKFRKKLNNGGFQCHDIIKTIQPIKSRVKEVKEDEYSNSLAKIQVCVMFHVGDIQRNVLLKFIRQCIKTEFLVSKETSVVLRRWEKSKQKFGFIKQVDKG